MSERQNSVTAVRPGIDSPRRERQSGIKIHSNYKPEFMLTFEKLSNVGFFIIYIMHINTMCGI